MSEWQPIKTAPRGNIVDGPGPRILLGWASNNNVAIANGEGGFWWDGYGGACINPTHWMPLPEPPSEGE